MDTRDIAIIGAGPTGTILAILLAQHGHSVSLIERQPSPYPLPRAVTFDHEVGRILQSCGIGPALRDQIEPADKYEWRNGDGLTLMRFGSPGNGVSGWPSASMFNQPALEQLLAERVGELSAIEVLRGRELIDFVGDEAGVSFRHRATADADDVSAQRARYLVGCDGANSAVRTRLGLDFEDLGFFFDWLVVDVMLQVERTYDPINLQVCDPRRPTTVVSGGPGRRRWEFMRLPGEDPEELSGEASVWRLLEPWDVHPRNAVLERHANYTFRARWAREWRRGRVFIAGDAAHQMPPFAGQGMCSGARDAANLAWKLDLVLRGHADDRLLDAYSVERMPNVEAVINFSMELGKVICIPDPVEAAARDDFLSAMASENEPTDIPPLPGVVSGIIDPGSPLAGVLFPQGLVGVTSPQPLDDVVGVGFRLVTIAPLAADPPELLSTWFEGIGGAIVTLGGESGLGDPTGTYADWFRRHEVTVALQRPDFSLFGTATDSAGAARLLQSLRRSLIGAAPPGPPDA